MALKRKHIYRVVFFILFGFSLFGILLAVTPALFRFLPNDYARIRLIIETLKSPVEPQSEIIIFGNSRGMSGVDGHLLEEKLPGNPVVYSFTSTGQNVGESGLHYTSVPASVKTIMQCIDIDLLSKPISIFLSNQVALRMYGYTMDIETEELLPALEKELDKPGYYYNFEARNCVFAGLTVILRNLLDDDTPESSISTELHYPTTQTSLRKEATYQKEISEQNKTNKFADYTIRQEWITFLNRSHQYFKSRNIDYYLLLMPYNPDITSCSTEEKQKALEMFKEEFRDIPQLDCFNVLDGSDFYDAIHPNDSGAKKITNRAATLLQQSYIPHSPLH